MRYTNGRLYFTLLCFTLRRLQTTGSERRSRFTTADDTGGERTVCSVDISFGLTPSRTGGHKIFAHNFVFEIKIYPRWGGRLDEEQNQQCPLTNNVL